MGREERKLKKHFEQREKDQLRKLKRKTGVRAVEPYQSDTSDCTSGLVIEVGPGVCTVQAGSEIVRCKHRFDIAAGDRVLFSDARRRVEEVLPRTTLLSRPDPNNARIQLVIAANIDVVVHVVSIQSPPLSPGLIDRYLIAIESSGADPLLCINKIDLEPPGPTLEPYRDIGIPIVECSAATGLGLDNLRHALKGKFCVFTGHSGVGKSSLLNALAPEAGAVTGDVNRLHGKGRHTTTGSRLHQLPGETVIIDTPGIRELGLWNVLPAEVRRYFHEFDELAFKCAFSDCSHLHEPRCAVKDAVASGAISRARYESYLRIIA